MPWLSEFGYALKMAADEKAAAYTADAVRDYVGSVHSGVADLGGVSDEQVVLYDPRAGRVQGSAEFQAFVESSSKWLAARNARTEWVASTVTPGRAVGELVAHVAIDGKDVPWPIAVVAELREGRAEFRVYYSQWPLNGTPTPFVARF